MLYYLKYLVFHLVKNVKFLSKYIKIDLVKSDSQDYVKRKYHQWFDEFQDKYETKPSVTSVSAPSVSKPTELPKDHIEHVKEESINNFNPRIYRDEDTDDPEFEVKEELHTESIKNEKYRFKERLKDIEDIDFEQFRMPSIKGNKESKKSILLLDDLPFVINLYENNFKKIKRNYNVDVFADFKLVYATESDCGGKILKYIYLDEINNKIDYAILDITLGYICRTKNRKPIEIDGIDIALILLDKNPNLQFKFISAHTLNKHNKTMQMYFDKFEKNTNLNIEDYYINKNEDQITPIYELLYSNSKRSTDDQT